MSSPNFEVGPPDRDLYLKAGGVPFMKLSTAGVLSPVGSGAINGATITNAALAAAGIGSWTDIAYAAGNYTGNGTVTWTVDSGDQQTAAYCRIGNVVFFSFWITQTTVAGTGTALQFALPAGITPTGGNNGGTIHYIDNVTPGTGLWLATATQIQFFKTDINSNWSAATNATAIRASIALRVA